MMDISTVTEDSESMLHAGPRTKSRLEFLLENDADLKKAIKKDDDKSNRCNDRDFVENDINIVRGRVPIARLEQDVKWLNLKTLSSYLSKEVLNDHVASAAACGKKPKTQVSYGKKEFEPWWWKHVAHILPWNVILRSFQNITVEEFKAIKGPGAEENLTESLKEILRIFLRVNNIDPESYVVEDYDKQALNFKRKCGKEDKKPLEI